jgi:hypothetical protein
MTSKTISKTNVRFKLINKTLVLLTRMNDDERHIFKISSTKEVTINKIVHTVITSDKNDVFYIVDGKFHREGKRPAIVCRRFDLNMTLQNGSELFDQSEIKKRYKEVKRFWCKMWVKNGQYHRTNDKPALIFDNGDLMWWENGCFKRNPFDNSSIYLPSINYAISYDSNDKSNMVFHDNKEKQIQEKKGLFNYSFKKDS